ncbi:MAG: TlpA disulfide reductase family protein [Pseudomonadota bacterium]
MAIPDGSTNTSAARDLSSLQTGDMAKLTIHDAPMPPMTATFYDAEGTAMTVADLSGKVVVLNFWATWCPPCREEMPSIDRLAGYLETDDITVMAVSTDRGAEAGMVRIREFFEEIAVENLAIYRDPQSQLARDAGAFGLPITVVLDRQGREIARLIGDAEWDTAEAQAIIRALAGAES